MNLSRGMRIALLAFTVLALVLVYTPLAVVVLNSFNASATFAWPPTELTLRRDYSFDESNVLGKAAEEKALLRDMHHDAAQQIIRRLAALKPQAAPATPVPGK